MREEFLELEENARFSFWDGDNCKEKASMT